MKELIELINASAEGDGFVIQSKDGKILPIKEGIEGTIITPSQKIKKVLFGDSPQADDLTKKLIIALGGKMKVGRKASATGAKRGPKPKNA